MSVVEYKNFDIVDLAIKQKLIGIKLKDKNGDYSTVTNYYLDFATNEIHIVFDNDKEADVFSFKQKFTVLISSNYKAIKKLRRKFLSNF